MKTKAENITKMNDDEYKLKLSSLTIEQLTELMIIQNRMLKRAKKHRTGAESIHIKSLKFISREIMFRKKPHYRKISIDNSTKHNNPPIAHPEKDHPKSGIKSPDINVVQSNEPELPEWYYDGMKCDWIDGIPQRPASQKEINKFRYAEKVVHQIGE